MKKAIFFFAAVLLITSCKKDEDVCETARYVDDIFTETKRINITYGKAISVTGQEVSLSMDIYQPVGDEFEERAVIIFAHGGSFVGGSRLDMQAICQASAKKGYVAASIDYRLLSISGGFPDSTKLADIVIKASQDMNAAVRFLRKSETDGNAYKIDPDNIYIGGVSAGAITALHAGLLDDSDPLPAYVKKVIADNGGLKGTSGTADALSFSSDVKGILNMSGAIISPSILDAKDPAIYSFHGDKDDVVPFDFGFSFVGPIPIVGVYGSNRINEAAKKVGIPSTLTVVSGGGHANIYLEERFRTQLDAFTKLAFTSLKGQVCN